MYGVCQNSRLTRKFAASEQNLFNKEETAWLQRPKHLSN
jgi:hypothetical protein